MNIINAFKSSDKNIDELVWKYEEKINLYNKYSQFLINNNAIITDIVINQEPIVQHVIKPVAEPILIEQVAEPILIEPVMVEPVVIVSKKPISESAKVSNIKKKKVLPIELIIKLTDNSELNREYIKAKLIETISLKSYIKIFGLKKSSEIMNGIIANKWNKSLVLFVSFLLDKTFIYLNKEVTFTKEANEFEKILL